MHPGTKSEDSVPRANNEGTTRSSYVAAVSADASGGRFDAAIDGRYDATSSTSTVGGAICFDDSVGI